MSSMQSIESGELEELSAMNFLRLFFGIVLTALVSLIDSSTVVISTVSYICCKSPALKFDQNCENTWSANGKSIAYFRDVKKSCAPPCKKIESGQMTLTACVDVNLTTVCHHTSSVVKETCVYYQTQPCPLTHANGAPRHQSSVGLALLTAVFSGWL